jgi:hypothetical protein
MGNDIKIGNGSQSGNGLLPGKDDLHEDGNDISTGEHLLPEILDDEKILGLPRKIILRFAAFIIFILLILFFNYFTPLLQEINFRKKAPVTNDSGLKKDPLYKKQVSQLERDVQRLSRKYGSYTSGQSYMVINTTDNRFMLYLNKKLIREGYCSSGSYKMLQTEEGRSWIFKTPKGKFWVQGKTTNPTWKRPDWSFVEEGLPIPPENHDSRFEYGVLGDYALSLGEGYLIHGTIYKRFIGMPVTHGCVRLNDEDLKAIFNTLGIGSKVYIF